MEDNTNNIYNNTSIARDFFNNLVNSSREHYNLVKKISDIVFGNKQCHIICGTNGSGKTTITRILSNILKSKYIHHPVDVAITINNYGDGRTCDTQLFILDSYKIGRCSVKFNADDETIKYLLDYKITNN